MAKRFLEVYVVAVWQLSHWKYDPAKVPVKAHDLVAYFNDHETKTVVSTLGKVQMKSEHTVIAC